MVNFFHIFHFLHTLLVLQITFDSSFIMFMFFFHLVEHMKYNSVWNSLFANFTISGNSGPVATD